MSRRVLVIVAGMAVVAGAVAGAVGALALQPEPRRTVAPPPTVPTHPIRAPQPAVLLAWTHNGLPTGLAGMVATKPGVDAVTVVRGGDLDLTASATADGRVVDRPPDGWSIPIDAIAVDPTSYPAFVPEGVRALMSSLAPGHALLGTTSARLRRLTPGGTLEISGRHVVIDGVVDDALVGAAEVVLSRDDGVALGLRERYLLVAYHGDRAAREDAIRNVLPPQLPARIRGPGETPFLRDGDAVLPQALIKERFGEFSYRRRTGRDIETDPAFASDNVVTAQVPLLGTVRCNRGIVDALRGALADLDASGLGSLVDRRQFLGCYVPRLIGPGESLSRHAWGVAFDLDVRDKRVAAVMRRWGFTSGASWLAPDPSHYEYLRAPSGA